MLTLNNIKVKKFTFPDGQQHINLDGVIDWKNVTEFNIKCSIKDAKDLIDILLVNEVIQKHNQYVIPVNLYIEYLYGARMDRRIGDFEPFTLKVVADILNTCRFSRIFTFNVHSDVSTNLLRSKNILPSRQVDKAIALSKADICVAPDKGSIKWVELMLDDNMFTSCEKKRDLSTGKLSGFTVLEPDRVKGKNCLIVDDICDGGVTFAGIAAELRKAGAKSVSLYVSHGIFSKGYKIEGIDKIYTTNSFKEKYPEEVVVFDAFAIGLEYIY